MKVLLFSLLALVFPFVVNAQSTQLPTQFIGRWKADCDRAGYIDVARDGSVSMEVNSNQIYIEAIAEIDKTDPTKIIIYLKGPADLGAGGMKLNWDKFSKTKPIAEIQALQSQKKKVFLFWNGFYNSKTKKYEWVDKADWFEVEGYNETLYKCKI